MKILYSNQRKHPFLTILAVLTFAFSVTLQAQTPCIPPGDSISPDAGTLTPKLASNCSGLQLQILEAAPDGNAVVPSGFQVAYLLTSGPNYVIRQLGPMPAFSVSGNNAYRIHSIVYDPLTFSLASIVPHVTTISVVNATLVQGGGAICASLDMVGAPFTVERPIAGTITPNAAKLCVDNGTAQVEATPDGNANVPYPYSLTYLLTSGTGQVIEQIGPSPSFAVSTSETYTIHSLVYNTATLDLTTVVPGVTTLNDVDTLLIQGGGNICASLDLAGASVIVEAPFAGALTADSATCTINISATADGNASVPAGYETIYVLTSGAGLVIEQTNATPEFAAPFLGEFTIHALVYDPATLDLTTITPGVTTAFDINSLLVSGGGSICASLDMTGASFLVDAPSAGTLTPSPSSTCSGLQLVNLEASVDGNTLVPPGYEVVYLLTSGPFYIIRQMEPTPNFDVSGNNLYRIQTLVYDPLTLDLSPIVLHQTSVLSINSSLIQGGGTICASLDMVGAQFVVQRPIAGTITAGTASICFDNATVDIDATPDGNANIPYPFQRIFVLTSGAGQVIEQTSDVASFTVSTAALYTIHTLICDTATLDLSTIVAGVTPLADINSLLVQGGGTICASLDLIGASTVVANPDAGTVTADDPIACLILGSASISATAQGDAVVPSGYQTAYLVTTGLTGIIRQIDANPAFTVTANGVYRIQTLIYDPATFSLASIVINTTTVLNLNGQFVQGGGTVCASVDMLGAVIIVLPFPICNFGNPRFSPDGEIDEQSYEYLKNLAEAGTMGAISIVNTYPNPASQELNLDLFGLAETKATISIYNVMGQQVYQFELVVNEGFGKHTIDVTGLEKGNYMIRITSGSEIINGNFAVIR